MTSKTTYTIGDLALALGLESWGDETLQVDRAAAPHEASGTAIAIASTPTYAAALAQGQARAALLWSDADPAAYGLEAAIFAPRPRFALSGLSQRMDPGPELPVGIHPTAVIDETASVGENAAIGPFVVIGARARIGPNARIMAYTSVGADASIGADALMLERVTIGARCTIGDRLIAQPGAVVGSDGFSFVTPEKSTVEAVSRGADATKGLRQQAYARIHSLGTVAIGDDVELGANCCIDRGTLTNTVIGTGTKLDNLVHIAHNVQVGQDCLLCGHCGIAGSTVIGDRCVFAGQSGAADNIKIGDDVIVSGATAVRTNQASGRILLGDPAVPIEQGMATFKALYRLPRIARDVAALRKHLPKTEGSD